MKLKFKKHAKVSNLVNIAVNGWAGRTPSLSRVLVLLFVSLSFCFVCVFFAWRPGHAAIDRLRRTIAYVM